MHSASSRRPVGTRPPTGPQEYAGESIDDAHATAGMDVTGSEDHGAVSTAIGSSDADRPTNVPKAVIEALASAISTQKHGLHMLMLCAENSEFVITKPKGNRVYQMLADIDSTDSDNTIYDATSFGE